VKAYSIAIKGTVASCTNHASIPPGEIRCWILAAAKDGVGAVAKKSKRSRERKKAAPRDNEMIVHERFSSRFGVVSLMR